jgi:hypothetical protein
MEESDYEQPSCLHIVFVDKINGYVQDTDGGSYEFIIKKDFIPFTTRDNQKINIFDKIIKMNYKKIEEFNMGGIININNKTYFLNNLTSISSYENMIDGVKYSDLIFNFGLVTEIVRFDSFEDSFKYLFSDEKSDIRLIQKIANSSLIEFRKGAK